MQTTKMATLGTLAGLGTGAALMYLFDPDRGERRRAGLRRGVRRASRRVAESSEALAGAVAERSREALDLARSVGLLPAPSPAQALAGRLRRLARSRKGKVALGTLVAAALVAGGRRVANGAAH